MTILGRRALTSIKDLSKVKTYLNVASVVSCPHESSQLVELDTQGLPLEKIVKNIAISHLMFSTRRHVIALKSVSLMSSDLKVR